jgi:ABC-type transport system involved in Fe-S cluster assembly fused permease/ATPase subunit
MVGAKVANVGVPVLLKNLVDTMTPKPDGAGRAHRAHRPAAGLRAAALVDLALRRAARADLRQGHRRRGAQIALEVFRHLHSLSLRFHLERQTGGMTRDIERGTRGVHSLISMSLYSIVPTLIELALVLTILGVKFDVAVRLDHRRGAGAVHRLHGHGDRVAHAVPQDHERARLVAQSRAVDSLLNYETVKYFNNEEFEAKRYDASLDRYRKAAIKSQRTLSMLNTGQQLLIAVSLVLMLWRATSGVVDGRMTLGDLVMVNAFMIQLYIPLNFLGVIYREIKQSLTDLDKMFVLMEKEREVRDAPGASPCLCSPLPGRGPLRAAASIPPSASRT